MTFNIKKCKNCKKLFQSVNSYSNICPECEEEMEELFTKVSDYIYRHPGAGVMQISRELEIDGQIVLSFIKEGRLTIDDADDYLFCKRCNKAIKSGEYCDECLQKLEKALNTASDAFKQNQVDDKEKKYVHMHINEFNNTRR